MTMWDDSGSDEDEMDPEEHSRMEVLCRAFEDLCHELRFHQKECVRPSNAGKRNFRVPPTRPRPLTHPSPLITSQVVPA
jgi:hypothetical protein